MPSPPPGPLEHYRDLFQAYDELALDNRHQLERTLARLPSHSDPVAHLHAVIDVLVGEIAHLKAELGHLRLEILAHAIPTPAIALQEERIVGAPPRSLEIDFGGVFGGQGWAAPERPVDGGPAFRRVDPEAGPGMVELALDRCVPLRCEWELVEAANQEPRLWVDGVPVEVQREGNASGEGLSGLLPVRLGSARLTRLALACGAGVRRLRIYPA